VSSYQVSLLAQAEAEIGEAFQWYFERSPLAASAFRSEVFEAIDRLANDAEMWPLDEDGVRLYHLRHFPFTIHYDLEGMFVTVLAVAHQRRRPGYWQGR
jgi:plasmid stabilization system protein ParE